MCNCQGSTRCAFLALAEAKPGCIKKIRHLAEHRMPKPNYIETRYILYFETCSYKVTVWMTSFLPERSQKLLIIITSWFFTIVSTKFTFEGFRSFMNWTETFEKARFLKNAKNEPIFKIFWIQHDYQTQSNIIRF